MSPRNLQFHINVNFQENDTLLRFLKIYVQGML